jgi:hypothetical protein
MRSYWVRVCPSPITGPCEREGDCHVAMEAEIGVMCLQTKGHKAGQ